MNTNKSSEQYPEKETAQRRDDALRRALNTPPQLHKPKKPKKRDGKTKPK